MQVDYQVPGQWWEFNELLTQSLQLPSDKVQVRAFKGLHAALCEVTQSLSQQFPHKKKAYFFKGMDPSLEGAMMALSRSGVQVEALELSSLDSGSWREALSTDSLCAVYSADDPLLGRRYSVSELESELLQKKIFSLRVSHALHHFEALPQELARPQLRVLSMGSDLALAFTHSRLRFVTPIAEGQSWPQQINSHLAEQLGRLGQDKESMDLVKAFEGSGPAGAESLWGPENHQRIYDRALIYWPDMDGGAVIETLAGLLSHALQPPGQDFLLESSSLSRWGGLRSMDWLKAQGLGPEVIRGLVILDQSLLTRPNILQILEQTRQHVVKLQNGE